MLDRHGPGRFSRRRTRRLVVDDDVSDIALGFLAKRFSRYVREAVVVFTVTPEQGTRVPRATRRGGGTLPRWFAGDRKSVV